MFDIPRFFSESVKKIGELQLDDAVDRLSYVITTSLLAVFAVMIGSKQHFGKPIQCMTPPEFRATNWEKYAEDYCFIQSTYSYPLEEQFPLNSDHEPEKVVGYYQWVPFIFLAQAFFFYLPNFFWQTLQTQTGMDQLTIVSEAVKLRSVFGKKREDGTVSLTAYIGDCLSAGSRKGKKEWLYYWLGRSNGLSVSVIYFLIKFFYLLNVVVQFFIVNEVVGSDYTFWGWQVLGDLNAGRTPVDSGLFPRVTMCDFKKRENGNTHDHSIQCVLMINMLNEKLFLFLWFWLLFVAVCTLVGFVYLLVTMVPSYFRERRVRHFLGAIDLDNYSGSQLRQFLYVKLGLDGLLLLRFIEQHAGALVARQLAARLWQWYHHPVQRAIDMGIDESVVADDDGESIKSIKKN